MVVFPHVGVLLEQRKRGLRVGKTTRLKKEEKRHRKAIFQKIHKKQRPSRKTEADNQGFPHVQDRNSISEREF